MALELLYLGGKYQGFATQADTEETIEVRQRGGSGAAAGLLLLLGCLLSSTAGGASAAVTLRGAVLQQRQLLGQRLACLQFVWACLFCQRCLARRLRSKELAPRVSLRQTGGPQCPVLAQGHLFRAMKKTRLVRQDATWQDMHYSRGGRTDKGVSALGQVRELSGWGGGGGRADT